MRLGPVDMLEVLVHDGIPKSLPGPDGRPRPPIPLGRRVSLPGRGTTFVREVAGPPGAPTLLLLHGWVASGGLNWFRAFETLGTEFHILAPDLRGHARGPLDGRVPTHRLRRRPRGPPRHAGRRSRARRRLLDGRLGGPTARSSAPRAGRRARALRDRAPVLPQACPGAADRQPARRGRERGAPRRTHHARSFGTATSPAVTTTLTPAGLHAMDSRRVPPPRRATPLRGGPGCQHVRLAFLASRGRHARCRRGDHT